MKLKTLIAIASTLFVTGVGGMAQAEIKYNYIQAVYQSYSEFDTYLWELKASYQIQNQFYVSMEDQNITHKRSGSLGMYVPLQNGMHVYGQVGLADYAPDNYPIVEGGVRVEPNGDVELRAAVRLEPEMPLPSGDTGETLLIGEGLFHLENNIDLVAGLVLPDENDGNVLRIGVRKNF